MARLEYFLVAGGCAIDQLTGRVSAFDVFVEVRPVSLPSIFPKLVTLASFVLDDAEFGDEFQLVVRVTAPGADPRNEIVARSNFVGRDRHHNIINGWFGIPIAAPGDLIFEAILNENHVARHEVTVHQADVNARVDGSLVSVTPTSAAPVPAPGPR